MPAPVVELVAIGKRAGDASEGDGLLPEPYKRIGEQIQSDVWDVVAPESLTFRVDRVPAEAKLSFGFAAPSVLAATAACDFDVTIKSEDGEVSHAFSKTISNLAHRSRVEVARIETRPRSANVERLTDGNFVVPWSSATSDPTLIRIDLARPEKLTAFAMVTKGLARPREGVPSALNVVLSRDGKNFDTRLRLDHPLNASHQWHLLPGEPVKALRIWVQATHDDKPAQFGEIVLSTEPDVDSLPNQLGRWNRNSIDLAAYRGQTIEATFAFGKVEAANRTVRSKAFLSRPRVDLARREDELNVILISVDTVRADRLSAFGYERPTTPFLDKLVAAPGAVRFTNVRSSSTWTPPSHLSMMVGRTPYQLHVNASRSRMVSWQRGRGGIVPLDPSIPTIASILHSKGYKTRAFSSAGGTVGEFGLRHGFDVYDQYWSMLPAKPLDFFGEMTSRTERIQEWLEANRRRKFFLLHTYVAHLPYKRDDFAACDETESAGARCRRYWAELYRADNRLRRGGEWGGAQFSGANIGDARTMSDLYDSGLLLVDEFLESVMATVDRLGLRDNTLVVITSDHGEPFGEHHRSHFDGGHGWGLYDEYLRVPLVFLIPGLDASIRSDTTASLVDIPPTVLDLLGIESTALFEGRTLAPAIYGEKHDLDLRPIFYEVMSREDFEDYHFIAASKKNFKILANPYNLFDGHHELFDLEADPKESNNIAKDKPKVAGDLLSDIDLHLAEVFEGMVVLDVSTLGRSRTTLISGTISFDRPASLFEIAVRRSNESVAPERRGDDRVYQIRLGLDDERRLIGFRLQGDDARIELRLTSAPRCKVRTVSSEFDADGSPIEVAVSDLGVAALDTQAELGRDGCSIGLLYVEPDGAVPASAVPARPSSPIDEEDRERILEQMRALGYIE